MGRGNSATQPQQVYQPSIPDPFDGWGRGFQYGGYVRRLQRVERVPAMIDGRQPARLTSSQYVLSADFVSRIGLQQFELGDSNGTR